MSLDSRHLSSTPKWVNPCGLPDACPQTNSNTARLSDNQLLQHIIVQAKNALSHANLFRQDFVERTFAADLDKFHRSWNNQRYDWLPSEAQIPKRLGEKLSREFLDKVQLETTLLDSYEFLQRFAVGLEQIAWDQHDLELGFLREFVETEVQLRSLLCEIQFALLEKGLELRADVSRDVMPQEHRSTSGSQTHMNLRDWLILRDYMNGLEFVVQVFEHLLTKLER